MRRFIEFENSLFEVIFHNENIFYNRNSQVAHKIVPNNDIYISKAEISFINTINIDKFVNSNLKKSEIYIYCIEENDAYMFRLTGAMVTNISYNDDIPKIEICSDYHEYVGGINNEYNSKIIKHIRNKRIEVLGIK